MINVTDTIKKAYEESTTQYDKIILNNKEYFINNVEYDDDCYHEGNVFGTAIARSLQFEIESEVDLEKKEFEYLTGIKTENGIEWISLGNFITQEPEPNDTNNTSKTIAMDYMLKSNIEYKTDLDYKSKKITILQVLQEACNKAGLELATTDFANKNFIVDSNQFTEGSLIRQVFQAVAQISGTFAKIRNDNKLYFITPKRNHLTVEEVNNMTIEKFNSIKVGKLIACENQYKCKDYKELILKRNTHPINLVSLGMSNIEGENIVKRDEESIAKNGENSLVINDNPFAYTQEKREQLIDALFNVVKGFEYTSFEIVGQSKPYIETGDEVLVLDKEGYACNSYLFRFNYKSRNGLESEMSAPSITKATVNYQNIPSALDIAKRTEIVVDKQNQTIKQVIEKTEENNKKIVEVQASVDGIKETVSSVETKVEEVESTANTANTNATQAQNTANEAKETAEITTKKVTEVEKTVDGISQNVEKVETTLKADYSTTEQMNSKIEQEAGKITNSVTEKIENIQVGGTNLVPNSAPYNLEGYGNYGTIKKELIDEKTSPSGKALKITAKTAGSFGIYIKPTKDIEIGKQYSYSVWIKANRAMKLSVGHEKGGTTYFDVTTQWKKYTYTYEAKNTSEYSSFLVNTKTAQIGDIIYIHSIKLEEGNKVTAWSPAPEDDVKGFEFGTKIEQNAKNVQVAWNNESQNIRIENDGGNSTMGFYDNDAKFAEMGVNNVDNNKYISFAVPCDYNKRIADGMAWGVQTPDGKFHPILFIKNFEMGNEQSDTTYGQLELSNCDLIIGGNYELGSGGAIVVGNITMAGDPLGGLSFIDDMGKYLFTINKGDGSALTPYDTIKILNNIEFFANQAGSNSLRVGTEENCCVLTDQGSISSNTVICKTLYETSLQSKKKNFEKLKSAIDIIKKVDIYKYNLKFENDTDKKHIGFVIGEKFNYSKDLTNKENDSVDIYSLASVCVKAIQEQQEIIENQNNLIQDLIKRVEKLEKGEQNGT